MSSSRLRLTDLGGTRRSSKAIAGVSAGGRAMEAGSYGGIDCLFNGSHVGGRVLLLDASMAVPYVKHNRGKSRTESSCRGRNRKLFRAQQGRDAAAWDLETMVSSDPAIAMTELCSLEILGRCAADLTHDSVQGASFGEIKAVHACPMCSHRSKSLRAE